MKYAVLFTALALAGCGGSAPVQERPVQTLVPVAQPCTDGPRPAPVPSLKQAVPDWYQRDVRQKSALVGKQGLDLRAYGEDLNAATGGCN